MLIAQISDFHLAAGGRAVYGVVDTASHLRRCVDALGALDPAPDVILATGDLVDAGSDDEYHLLREILTSLASPVFVIPGNHDEREAFLRGFADQPYLDTAMNRVRYVVDGFPLRLIGLDTVTPGAAHGNLDDESLEWLDQTLGEQPQRPTLVFMHHPPFRTGIRYMDDIGLDHGDALRLGTIVSRHSQIRKMVCGHLHRAIETHWYGVPVSTAPSCAHQIELHLGAEPSGTFTLEPPGYHLHWWDGDRIVTHVTSIGEFPGPFRFGTGELVGPRHVPASGGRQG